MGGLWGLWTQFCIPTNKNLLCSSRINLAQAMLPGWLMQILQIPLLLQIRFVRSLTGLLCWPSALRLAAAATTYG
jgi:hypothetical protein